MKLFGETALRGFVKKYFGDPKKIKGIGDGTATGAIKTVSDKANENTTEITQINKDLTMIKNRKWYLFGDSISAIETGFTATLKQRFGNNFYFSAIGSMRYSTNTVSSYLTFTTKLDEWLPGIQNKDQYTDILIELGSNDVVSYNYSAFKSGFSSAITKIKNNFPNAQIHIAIVGKQMTNAIYNQRQIVIKNLKEFCGTNKCLWVPRNENILGSKNDTFDTIHPTEAAHTLIADALTSYMLGGGCIPRTAENNVVSSGLMGLQITEAYEDGKYTVQVQGTISKSDGFAIPGQLDTVGTTIGSVQLKHCYRNIAVNGWLQAKLTIFGQTIIHQIPCCISITPSSGSDLNCTVALVASYDDYYRDSSGGTKDWTTGFSFTEGIFNGAPATIPA